MFNRHQPSREEVERKMIEDMHKMEREIIAEQKARRAELEAMQDLSVPNSPNAPREPENAQERKTSMFLQFGKAMAKCYGTMIACSCACEEKSTVEPAKPR